MRATYCGFTGGVQLIRPPVQLIAAGTAGVQLISSGAVGVQLITAETPGLQLNRPGATGVQLIRAGALTLQLVSASTPESEAAVLSSLNKYGAFSIKALFRRIHSWADIFLCSTLLLQVC